MDNCGGKGFGQKTHHPPQSFSRTGLWIVYEIDLPDEEIFLVNFVEGYFPSGALMPFLFLICIDPWPFGPLFQKGIGDLLRLPGVLTFTPPPVRGKTRFRRVIPPVSPPSLRRSLVWPMYVSFTRSVFSFRPPASPFRRPVLPSSVTNEWAIVQHTLRRVPRFCLFIPSSLFFSLE